ncbi:MAG: 4-hydroxy-3-methylbut-2-enyl diphosphate reductase [Muribaculaceae bacterium]|nr:4-hydroxy-3-methylbut-2-enyl diphosphate reductase [Muribaculaceae bacterium]
MVKVEIDEGSGFCFGVVTAIRKAEEELSKSGRLYCLGDIVHNSAEVERLRKKGLVTISHEDLEKLHDVKVLLRAHGEPPSTYELARRNNIEIIDATCPVVLQLQQRIKKSYDSAASEGVARPQIVIYGKKGHAEVNGLVGQTSGEAVVVQNVDELDHVDYTRDILLYSQTTKSLSGFQEISSEIERRQSPGHSFKSYDTICRQVANRVSNLRDFAEAHQLIIFVSGKKSSNGRFLFEECKAVNPNSMMVTDCSELSPAWLEGIETIGICGATSTPRWLMENVRDRVIELVESASDKQA